MSGHIFAAANGSEAATVDLSGGNLILVIIVGVIALVALVMAVVFRGQVLAAGEGTENMRTIARAVQEGANAYLTRQFRTLAIFAAIAFFALLALPADDMTIRIFRSVFFLVGAGFSATVARSSRAADCTSSGCRKPRSLAVPHDRWTCHSPASSAGRVLSRLPNN